MNSFRVEILLLFSTSWSVRSVMSMFFFLKFQQGWTFICQLKSIPPTKGNSRHSAGMINIKVACLDVGQRSWKNSGGFARILLEKGRQQ